MQGDVLIPDKELRQLLDKAYAKLKQGFNPKDILFLDRIKRKVQRFKKLNEVEEKKLREIAN